MKLYSVNEEKAKDSRNRFLPEPYALVFWLRYGSCDFDCISPEPPHIFVCKAITASNYPSSDKIACFGIETSSFQNNKAKAHRDFSCNPTGIKKFTKIRARSKSETRSGSKDPRGGFWRQPTLVSADKENCELALTCFRTTLFAAQTQRRSLWKPLQRNNEEKQCPLRAISECRN